MTGLIVSLPPVSNFPGGALTYAFHAAEILDSPIYAPGGIAKEFCPSHLSVRILDDITVKDVYKSDYSLITTFGKDLESYLPELPRPVIAVIHDGHTLYEFGGVDWANKIDGFLVDVEPTKKQILEFVKNASMLRIPIPYIKKNFELNDDEFREDAIVSLGRIVPERGHRLVVSLCSLGYKVYVVGQEVRHDEFGLYYGKIAASGANIISTPTDSEKDEVLSRVKVSMSFPFTYEIEEPIEFSTLESINMGVYPIVARWQSRYFSDAGFEFTAVDSPAEAVQYVEKIFRDHKFYHAARRQNMIMLENYQGLFKNKFLKFVDSVKNRKKCSICGQTIPVGCMYCAFCGKR